MRDGINLSADIYLPIRIKKEGYPTILLRTPYDNTYPYHIDMAKFFVLHDYIYVVQDVRGRCDSEGEWEPYKNEGYDGFDTIEWIASQPWCNGKIGMMGGSYKGFVQWAAAREKPPHLKTIVPTAAAGNFMREIPYNNGILGLWYIAWLHLVGGRSAQWNITSVVDWKEVFYHLPLLTMDEKLGRLSKNWREILNHPSVDDYWKDFIFAEDNFKKINLPVLHITGWYDGDQSGALFFYNNMIKYSPAANSQYIIIGPWTHAGTRTPNQTIGEIDFSTKSIIDIKNLHLDWFDYTLKGEISKIRNWKLTKYFIMGRNVWKEENSFWAAKQASKISYYLSSAGSANSIEGTGRLIADIPSSNNSDKYLYDPNNPIIIIRDWDIYSHDFEDMVDYQDLLNREDILVYKTAPLESDITIAGNPVLEFFGSSSCFDTDWFISLTDVHPDRKCISLRTGDFGKGALRARYRNSLEYPDFLEPGKIYKFSIELDSICNEFKKNHRIQVAIMSSAFPIYARNLNTRNQNATSSEVKIAENKVLHGKDYPSRLILPLLN
jgi:putative CocE/NonD family hydrolase